MKVKEGEFFIFQTRVFKFGGYERYEGHEKIQNFSSISVKLCLLGQKTQQHGL